jgi:hypothetical protein
MSVLIKGMEMPKGCIGCLFKDIGTHTMTQCMLVAGWVKYADGGDGIPDACPLVDVPTPHGRLIDVDAFKADYGMKDDCADCEKEIHGKVKSCEYDRTYSKMDFCSWIGDADVVIEAEGKDED